MALKNYTSKIPIARSMSFIEDKLVQHGARQIIKDYGNEGEVKSLCFVILVGKNDVPFKLPAKVKECEKVLRGMRSSRARPESLKNLKIQAGRTAWKILSDWVEVQMAMVELAQVDVMEVFLPYVYDPSTQLTLFEKLKKDNFRKLLPGPAR